MKLRKFTRRFSISAPRLAVRPHIPWYVRWAIIVPFLVLATLGAWLAYVSGLEFAGFNRGQTEQELSELRGHVASLESENTKLQNQVAAYERQIQIEQSANAEIGRQAKAMNEEITALKEDLSFFQNLPLSGGSDDDLSIHRLKVEADNLPGEYHCRLLLVQGIQHRGREFQGKLQLIVNGTQNGEKVVLQFPYDDESRQLNFKYYQRIDRIFKVPPEMRIESVQVRVFEKGAQEPKIKQTVGVTKE
jgi:exonuclease VII small subunit